MIEHPHVRQATAAVAVPVVKWRIRRRGQRAGEQLRRYGEVASAAGNAIAEYGPPAAQALGLLEPPKRKRSAPRVGAGLVLGAGLMYLADPQNGAARRTRLLSKLKALKASGKSVPAPGGDELVPSAPSGATPLATAGSS